jgi:hypothetical protein
MGLVFDDAAWEIVTLEDGSIVEAQSGALLVPAED